MGKDLQRANLISKHMQLIRGAIKEGGSPDPKVNKTLADAVEQARSNQVPVDSIQRLLTASKEGKETKKQVWPVKGPGGSIVIVEIETDHVGKTKQEIASIVKKNQCIMTDLPSVMYQFKHQGVILCSIQGNGNTPVTETQIDETLSHALESGAEDVTVRHADPEYGTVFEFITEPDPASFFKVRHNLEKLNYTVVHSSVEYIASDPVELSDAHLGAIGALCDKLLNHGEVTRIFDNIA